MEIAHITPVEKFCLCPFTQSKTKAQYFPYLAYCEMSNALINAYDPLTPTTFTHIIGEEV